MSFLPIDTDSSVFHTRLAKHNASRLAVGVPSVTWENDEFLDSKFRLLEGKYLEELRQSIRVLAEGHEESTIHFVDWFKSLAEWGPGQHHPLFDWLEHNANLEEMKWFLTQEVAGEAGFEDLIAYTQVKLPAQAKLECARNYWDEMGRGKQGAMHGPLLERMVDGLNLRPSIDTTVWQSLALGNAMVAMATTRRYTYHSLGALGAIELTAPGRAVKVAAGMERLGIDQRLRSYFELHAVIDVAHSESWIREIIHPLVTSNPECARYIAEGALMRLQCGKQCFDRYSNELGVDLIPIEFTLPNSHPSERVQW